MADENTAVLLLLLHYKAQLRGAARAKQLLCPHTVVCIARSMIAVTSRYVVATYNLSRRLLLLTVSDESLTSHRLRCHPAALSVGV